jgi:hypothetical protein
MAFMAAAAPVLGAVSSVASIGGTIMGGMGQSQQYDAASQSASYQAQVAKNNQIIAEQNARYATQAGRANAQAQDFQTRAQIGTAAAAQGASGVDVTQGSPVEVRSSIGQLGRLKTLQEIQQSQVEAYGQEARATGFGAEAGLQEMKARSAQAAKGPAMLGTILGGASSLSDKWLRFQSPYGGFGRGGPSYSGDFPGA